MTGVFPADDPRLLVDRCVAFDLEIGGDGGIQLAGAVRGDRTLTLTAADLRSGGVRALEELAAGADFLVGHNVLFHDLCHLQAAAPGSPLLAMPVLDTLLLSPLAYPRRPYHRLVKDYKLAAPAANDPAGDARLALRVLGDCTRELARAPAALRDLCAWAVTPRIEPRHAATAVAVAEPAPRPLTRSPPAPPPPERDRRAGDHGGHATWFAALGATPPADPIATFAALHHDRTCRTALAPAFRAHAAHDRLPLAYVSAWLSAADTGSVLPAWVRRAFPAVIELVRALRTVPCDDADCAWCRTEHDATEQLRRWFGFDSFRPEPRAPDGGSLQQAVVEHGMRDRSLLAILPTGGGKSLCFQVPALARHRRSGQLTVVISPLQALMKDQVDGFERRAQSNAAAALNGLLTPPERADVLERVRLGEVALLYVSPEQLRSTTTRRALEQREIGAWVFDEAHCLSKWGHDFRPDYLYAARFIREAAAAQHRPVPAIMCLTATAKRDVRDEIVEHFRHELGRELALFEGGVERRNLEFVVEEIPRAQKHARVRDLAEEILADAGAVIVYCRTRRETEEAAEFLQSAGLEALAYHAGLDAAQRRERQNAFLRDDVRVVCATNAFGMGIDKPDVRLVVHAQMPASLENYLQEAGRAGRDQAPARCVLLHSPEDPEDQFRLLAGSRLSQDDIAAILKQLRRLRKRSRGGADSIVVTTGEILRNDDVETSFGPEDRDAPTRVVTAIAWLERRGFLAREENRVGLISARPKLLDARELTARLSELDLPPLEAAMWRQIHRALSQAKPDEGLDTDDLAGLSAFRSWEKRRASTKDPRLRDTTASQKVLRVLYAMAKAGLVTESLRLTAFVRDRVADSSTQLLAAVADLEVAMLELLREAAPDADSIDAGWTPLSLRELNQRLLDRELDSHPDTLRHLLRGLARDGQGLAGRRGSIELRHGGGDAWQVRLGRRWDDLVATAALRRDVARVALEAMASRIPKGAPPRKDQLVEFAIEDIRNAVDGDLLLRSQLEDPLAAIDRALMFMHELGVIVLQRGLSVFRRAMHLTVPAGELRRYGKQDYAPLRDHYEQQTQGVHVMSRFAEQGVVDIGDAQRLVADYFALTRDEFVRRHCADRVAELGLQTTPQSRRRIVDDLRNPAQQAIVTAPEGASMLVLAGPGSGKTRVVVHRCAYLLRVLRVPPRSILLICFNRATAIELRRRLTHLVGSDAAGVTVTTYHGVAARLCGRSFATRAADRPVTGEELDGLLTEAAELLEGERVLRGLEPDEQRERLMAGFRHVLVDEYQDIDARQYRLVRALAARGDAEPTASLLAVGDDDQAIYGFRNASVEFIGRFCADHDADRHELVENYRSTPSIVVASNAVITPGRHRMKQQALRVDAARGNGPAGEPVTVVEVGAAALPPVHAQAVAAFEELMRLRLDVPDRSWSSIAVLAWQRETLAPVRALCEARGVPVRWAVDDGTSVGPWAIREIAAWLDAVRARVRSPDSRGMLRGSELRELREIVAKEDPTSPWWSYVDGLLAAWSAEVDGDVAVAAGQLLDFLDDCMVEDRRQRGLRDGIELRTLHGSKGLEFPAVVLLDGGFGPDDGSTRADEERRLYYVGATRARERLTVLARDDASNPHVARILAAGADRRTATLSTPPDDASVLDRRYQVIRLDELFLDFAGRRPADHCVHRALRALTPGDPLRLVDHAPRARLLDASGEIVAELSTRGTETWRPRIAQIESIRVLAMLRRTRDQLLPDYATRCTVDRWELPLVEVVSRG